MNLVIAEQLAGQLNPVSWEALAAARVLGGGGQVDVLTLGAEGGVPARDLARAAVGAVHTIEQDSLEPYTPDGYACALVEAVGRLAPRYVLLPHTYRTRDFVGAVAARLGRAPITDCIAIEPLADGRAAFVRAAFQGRLIARVVPEGEPPWFVTTQVGAFRADGAELGGVPAPIVALPVHVDQSRIRQRAEPPFRASGEPVDLSQAERVVAVGRGIGAREHVELAGQLARALEAELGASRPICDAGWLPLERQIGSSGQTVAPKLYLALGISGAIQHLIGMKAARTIVAINRDPDAPIFEIADFGIRADLFEVVPALIAELDRAARSG
jgi:electron transfer flavoprotein alpha subunit